MGYPNGESVKCSPGKIAEILEDKEFEHNCDTDKGYSGSPIILATNLTVIGIHRGRIIEQQINRGIFLGIIVNKISNCDTYIIVLILLNQPILDLLPIIQKIQLKIILLQNIILIKKI